MVNITVVTQYFFYGQSRAMKSSKHNRSSWKQRGTYLFT